MSIQSETTVSPHEDQWDSHWDDFGKANERNPAQEYRRRLATGLLERQGPPARLLDIGCGNGEFLAAAAARWPGAELRGLELSEAAVAEARRKVPSARVRACDLLAQDDDALARALTTKLLTFATGREMGFTDRAEIASIVDRSGTTGHGVRDLIRQVVASEIFRRK